MKNNKKQVDTSNIYLSFLGVPPLGHASYERPSVRNGCQSGDRGGQSPARRQDLLFLRPALPGQVPQFAGGFPYKSPGNTSARPSPGGGSASSCGPAYRIYVPDAPSDRAAGSGGLSDLRHGPGASDPRRGA